MTDSDKIKKVMEVFCDPGLMGVWPGGFGAIGDYIVATTASDGDGSGGELHAWTRVDVLLWHDSAVLLIRRQDNVNFVDAIYEQQPPMATEILTSIGRAAKRGGRPFCGE